MSKITFRSEKGKHIVTYKGEEHIFDLLHDAWDYIFTVRFINKKLK